jgi:propanol-preferring alcohol dehydrogenase
MRSAADAWVAMTLEAPGRELQPVRRALPEPGPGELRVSVTACGVCRTDLHLVDGELPFPGRPFVPGHEVVGLVDAVGEGVGGFRKGQRVGIPWLGWTCGRCEQCLAGRENLCPNARFTGWQIDGGYSSHAVADARYAFPLPDSYDDQHAAPLLCAGLVGYRAYSTALSMCNGVVHRVGLYGFGASAHLIAQVAVQQGRDVFAFTRDGDAQAQALACRLGAVWAGPSEQLPPAKLDAAILFAPVGALLPAALRAVRPAGAVICAGIHMSDVPSFPYSLLWGERRIASVANLTRSDGEGFLHLAARLPLQVTTVSYELADANRALDDLRAGLFAGAAVLVP